ncbi:2-dehydro-3-deoxygalactonokinase [Siccirubricoccus phaeus]|uniref:2-dehydro-3-deoxygalactonokinase n=1 Tax=Siccirubricoccus phaeus TaxID=2595053 RepID=UPI0011F1A990|nr:2-dehydro-3-deoxygalactonokinase [Siccirubricoccus phaeus]
MIGIDWGTTSLRAYRLAADGTILGRIEREAGILTIPAGGFPAALEAAIGPWLAQGESQVLLCGMVGSRQGWVEAPYLPCPAGPAEIAACLTRIPHERAELWLVPGLEARDAGGVPDVMRGEETKLIGLLAALGEAPALACLPGTHSKWAWLEGGRISRFATQMTGEVRAVLLAHSILGRMAGAGPTDAAAFRRGVRRAREAGGLLHHLFGTRGLGLMGELSAAETASYLSGLLIGHEIGAVQPAGTVLLAGAEALTKAYALAFEEYGLAWRLDDVDLAARGLHSIAVLREGSALS